MRRLSEELKELPVPFYLSLDERQGSRALYEEAFPEDTKNFVDYYYQYKTRDNEILGLREDGRLVSMLHLNPYTMIVNGYEVESDYIVAVATHKDYRRRGYMRLLMEKALKDAAAKRMPFVFLMPASISLYAPFDFVWICPHTRLPKRVEAMDADSQNRYLAARCQMFCKRDRRYMENLRAQERAEAGEATAGEGKVPPYLARATDVCQMLKLTNGSREQRLILHVKDSIIRGNDGYFLWEVSPKESRAEKLFQVPTRVDLDLTIGELASLIFKGFRICLSEWV